MTSSSGNCTFPFPTDLPLKQEKKSKNCLHKTGTLVLPTRLSPQWNLCLPCQFRKYIGLRMLSFRIKIV